MEDIWRDVIGSNGAYKIDITGRVKNLDSYKNIGYGRKQPRPSKILKVYTHCNGYLAHRLILNGKSRIAFIHRMLAQVFIPNPENKPFINHKNGIKTDNRIENLEWVTSAENNKHAYSLGLNTGSRRVSFQQVCQIRALRKHLKMPNRTLAAMYCVTEDTISQYVNNRLRING